MFYVCIHVVCADVRTCDVCVHCTCMCVFTCACLRVVHVCTWHVCVSVCYHVSANLLVIVISLPLFIEFTQ